MRTTLIRRVKQLEERFSINDGQPRKVDRTVVRVVGCDGSLENAACKRTLCPDGTLIEVIRLDCSSDTGGEKPTAEALDRFVERFPIEIMGNPRTL